MLARGIVPVAGGMLLGVVLGCTVDLAHRIACGDGYVDEIAGEECDPLDPDSYKSACINEQRYGAGVGGCDPTTCRLLVNDVQCAFCGDKVKNDHPAQLADEGDSETDGEDTVDSSETGDDAEECDDMDVVGMCPDMVTPLRCKRCKLDDDHCPEFCGDGIPNGNEQCDVLGSIDDLSGPMQECAPDKLGQGGVPSPFLTTHVYGSGTTRCNGETCRWRRAPCSYCGNGKIDKALLIDDGDPPIISDPEVCDGILIDEATVVEGPGVSCSEMSPTLRPNVRCDEDCGKLVQGPADEPPCCTVTMAICPGPDEPQCCSAYLHADDVIPFEPCTEASNVEPSYCR